MPPAPPDEAGAAPPGLVADVLVPVAVDTAYSYRVPPHLRLEPGRFVAAPLGTRIATGVVWATRAGAGDNLKSIVRIRDWPALRQPLRDFIDWVARWTLTPRGAVLRMAVRTPDATAAPPPKRGLRKTGKPPDRLTPARARVLAALEAAAPMAKSALAAAAACGPGVIDGLVEDGALASVELPPEPVAPAPDPEFGRRPLEPDQEAAADALARAVEARSFRVFLLEGVTGAGKTEVYFEAVAASLRSGRQALILLPEIALGAQFLDRFAARFGVRPGEWHSGITPRQRERLWATVASGEARVVVGARSALFLPFADLGLIVVDEEHEGAYKQEDGVV
jgi:primosomal protein N' (replication factor Y) (superfamily II helicase)